MIGYPGQYISSLKIYFCLFKLLWLGKTPYFSYNNESIYMIFHSHSIPCHVKCNFSHFYLSCESCSISMKHIFMESFTTKLNQIFTFSHGTRTRSMPKLVNIIFACPCVARRPPAMILYTNVWQMLGVSELPSDIAGRYEMQIFVFTSLSYLNT